jgi:PIN domain nuclease of toxin-antitoxin system
MNIGKYRFNGGFSAFNKLVESNGFSSIPIQTEYMERLIDLPLIHRDPFDRLIISTSIAEGLTIITADENIQRYNVNWIWKV